jgi:hypothetical protein
VLPRLILKVLIFLGASIFGCSLWVVGMRNAENMKLLGGGVSMVLALSAFLSVFFEFKRKKDDY